MRYNLDFKFQHHTVEHFDSLRADILKNLGRLNGEGDPPITEEQRPGVERHLALQMSAHVTLQIRDAWLQMFVRVNRENGSKLDWTNPWTHLDIDDFYSKSDEQLLEEMRERYGERQKTKQAKHDTLVARRRLAKAELRWYRPKSINDRYQVIDGRLHEVREQRRTDGTIVRDVNPHPIRSTSVCYRGERISIPGLVSLLTTGLPWTRTPKPKKIRFKAQVRQGSKVVHLGMFDTEHERDAAVLNHRLGLSANPAP